MAGSYIPPLSEIGSEAIPGQEDRLAPGVRGYAVRGENGKIYIPYVVSDAEGNGAFGKFLSSLDPKCFFSNVISARLRGMLERRGWKVTYEDVPDDEGGGICDIWNHPEAKL